MKAALDVIERKIKPTESERRHVLEFQRSFELQRYYGFYSHIARTVPRGHASDEPAAQIRQLQDRRRELSKEIAEVWPQWQEVEQKALLEGQ